MSIKEFFFGKKDLTAAEANMLASPVGYAEDAKIENGIMSAVYKPMMDIIKITNTIIREKPALVFPLKYDDFGQMIFDAENNHVADLRGWGKYQYHAGGHEAASALQDAIGIWIVSTLNAAYEEEKNKHT